MTPNAESSTKEHLLKALEGMRPWVEELIGDEANLRIVRFDDKGDMAVVFNLPPATILGRTFYTVEAIIKYMVTRSNWNIVLYDTYGDRKPQDCLHPHDRGSSFCMDPEPLQVSAFIGDWLQVVVGLLAQSASFDPSDAVRHPSGMQVCTNCGSDDGLTICANCEVSICEDSDDECSFYCDNCGRRYCHGCFGDEEECSECYNKATCTVCDTRRWREDMYTCDECGDYVCASCYSSCEVCNGYACDSCLHETDSHGFVCNECYENKCEICDDYISHRNSYVNECSECDKAHCEGCDANGDLCVNCYEESDVECSTCGQEVPASETRTIGMYSTVCADCSTIGVGV